MNTECPLIGRWRIVEVAGVRPGDLDVVSKAHLTLSPDHRWRFLFAFVEGGLESAEVSEREGAPRVDFSWRGRERDDPAWGDGWAELRGERLSGEIRVVDWAHAFVAEYDGDGTVDPDRGLYWSFSSEGHVFIAHPTLVPPGEAERSKNRLVHALAALVVKSLLSDPPTVDDARPLMLSPTKSLLRKHHVDVHGDNAFQRSARLLQALWREENDLPIGLHRDRPLGSRLAMPQAKDALSNYLTPTIRKVVRREVIEGGRGKLFSAPRIFDDLLSSQPLCFNLFGELAEDLELATHVFHRRLPDRVERVDGIEFEWSPGRRDERFTGDNSAFDVFVRYTRPDGRNGFVGIEVKYHEDLSDKPAAHRRRCDEVARGMEAFRGDALETLRTKPLQQLWRDHLLAGSMLQADSTWAEGLFVLLYPRENERCAAAASNYANCLRNRDTFAAWTLEDLSAELLLVKRAAWVRRFVDRYLDFGKVDALVGAERPD